jgi:hypothetical protein
MNHNSPRSDWFFPIDEAPVLAAVTYKGATRNVVVPHRKALVAADTGDIFPSNTMTDIASRPPQSPRFRRDRPTLERRAGVWLRDFMIAASRTGFSVAAHLDGLAKSASAGPAIHR